MMPLRFSSCPSFLRDVPPGALQGRATRQLSGTCHPAALRDVPAGSVRRPVKVPV